MNVRNIFGCSILIVFFLWIFYFIAVPLSLISHDETPTNVLKYIMVVLYTGSWLFVIYGIWDGFRAYKKNIKIMRLWENEPEALMLKDVSEATHRLEHPIAFEYKEHLTTLGILHLGKSQNAFLVNYEYSNGDYSIVATICPRGPITVDLSFQSVFEDGFQLITGYYCMTHADLKWLYQSRVDSSIEDAHTYHCQQIEALSFHHGAPVKLDSIAQIAHYNYEYLHGTLKTDVKFAQRAIIVNQFIMGITAILFPIGVYGILVDNYRLGVLPVAAFVIAFILYYRLFPEDRPVIVEKRKSKA